MHTIPNYRNSKLKKGMRFIRMAYALPVLGLIVLLSTIFGSGVAWAHTPLNAGGTRQFPLNETCSSAAACVFPPASGGCPGYAPVDGSPYKCFAASDCTTTIQQLGGANSSWDGTSPVDPWNQKGYHYIVYQFMLYGPGEAEPADIFDSTACSGNVKINSTGTSTGYTKPDSLGNCSSLSYPTKSGPDCTGPLTYFGVVGPPTNNLGSFSSVVNGSSSIIDWGLVPPSAVGLGVPTSNGANGYFGGPYNCASNGIGPVLPCSQRTCPGVNCGTVSGASNFAAFVDDGGSFSVNGTSVWCINVGGSCDSWLNTNDPAYDPPHPGPARWYSNNDFDNFVGAGWLFTNFDTPPAGKCWIHYPSDCAVTANGIIDLTTGFIGTTGNKLNDFSVHMQAENTGYSGNASIALLTFKYPNPPPITGTVRNSTNPTTMTIPGVTVQLSSWNGSSCGAALTTTTTDANGKYSFNSPIYLSPGDGYCVNVINFDHRTFDNGINVYPTDKPYKGCVVNAICTSESQYDSQYVGVDSGGNDRSVDDGLDFVLYPIVYGCNDFTTTVEPNTVYNMGLTFGATSGSIAAGDTMNYTISFTVPAAIYSGASVSGSWTPPPSNYTYNVNGLNGMTAPGASGTYTGTYRVIISFGGTTYFDNGATIPPTVCHITVIVATKPYLKVYGNDVAAGGGFGTSVCAPDANSRGLPSGYIFGSFDDVNKKGASVQFAAMALYSIDHFSSAILRSTAPNADNGLTLANTGALVPSPYGGNFGVSHCIPDYYGNKPPGLPTFGGNSEIIASSTTSISYTPASGTLQLSTATPPFPPGLVNGQRIALYVHGNVYITGSGLIYQSTVWPTINDIPSLYLIVQGNIFIDPSVTTLDGVYVAQRDPATGTGGKIYTCSAPGGAIPSASQIVNTCNNKLTIHGSFIAQEVKFLRSNGTIHTAPNPEYSSSPNIAEVFDFSPEAYLVTPPLPPTDTTGVGNYQFITSLPPVL